MALRFQPSPFPGQKNGEVQSAGESGTGDVLLVNDGGSFRNIYQRGCSMNFFKLPGRLMKPLRSRKVRVALTTVVAAYAAEYGLGVSEEVILTLVSVGVALILGIAHEDAGRKQIEGIK